MKRKLNQILIKTILFLFIDNILLYHLEWNNFQNLLKSSLWFTDILFV